MSDELLKVLIIITALGAGLVAGIFFAFSSFVMKALGRIPPAQGITAMQSINIVVINIWFMTAFFGTAVTCVILVVISLLNWHYPGTVFLLVGSALYLFGTIMVTIACNVPRNNALAAIEPNSDDGAQMWGSYLKSWTIWNHVRTAAAFMAAMLFIIALL